jgi:hypothetical protein
MSHANILRDPQLFASPNSRSVERDSRFLRCEHCDDKQYYHPVQLRLLLILDVHLGLWNHSQDIAETHLVDVLLPLQHSLHACKVRSRTRGILS